MVGDFEAPAVDGSSSKAGVGFSIVLRSGLDGDGIAPASGAQVLELVVGLERLFDVIEVVFFRTQVGHARQRAVSSSSTQVGLRSEASKLPPERMRFEVVPMLDEAADFFNELLDRFERPVLEHSLV